MLKQRLRSILGLRLLYNKFRMLSGSTSQSDEHRLITQFLIETGASRRFVEFGFHPREFNSAPLVEDGEGLLLDGDPQTVAMARKLLPRTVDIRHQFLTLESIGSIAEWVDGRPLGLLSIDVDGNDFWFAEALLPLSPALAVLEYNASLGLQPLTVPYDPQFMRAAKHASGWYHGASLTAMERLGRRFGYRLVGVSAAGGNAFFLRGDLLPSEWPGLDPRECYRESDLRNHWGGNRASDQWAQIAHLPFVSISKSGHPGREQQ